MGTKEVFKESCDTYIDINDNLTFLADGSSFVMTSERDEFNHIYKFDFEGNAVQLTQGEWDVVDVLGFDAKRKRIYFSSSKEGATQKHTSHVDMRGRVTTLDATSGTHSDDFSNSFDYSIHQHSTANTPPVYTLRDRNGRRPTWSWCLGLHGRCSVAALRFWGAALTTQGCIIEAAWW